MEKLAWKITAIVFMILFFGLILLIGLGFYLISEDERLLNECYYNVCSDYPDAEVMGNVCFCYDYDVIGNLVVVDSEVMR